MTQFNALVVAMLTTALATLSMSLPAYARPVQYRCSVKKGIPTTIARTPQGIVEVITWKSKHFSSSGFSPTKRCKLVSARFQKHSNQGSLRYITVGKLNNQKVMCVAQTRGGACRRDGLLLTFEPQDNPQRVLRDLFNVASRSSNGPTGRDAQQIYININNYLQSAPNVAPDSTENEIMAPREIEPQQKPVSPTPAGNSQADDSNIW